MATPELTTRCALRLPLDFVDLLRSMWNGLLTVAAFFVSASVFQQNGPQLVAGQYLLGLGTCSSAVVSILGLLTTSRRWRCDWVRSHDHCEPSVAGVDPDIISPVVETNLMVSFILESANAI